MEAPRDVVLQGGTVFDGRGGDGVRSDVRVCGGRIAQIAPSIAPPPGAEVVDARGAWVTPGFIDLHTHYDAEVELLPGLNESVRHGVTSVVLGSCSLSLAVGDPVDLADMFCRVEAVPREVVLPLLRERKDWGGPAEYFDHLEKLPLGPNVGSFLGHSAMRAHAMGLGRSLTKKTTPTAEEMAKMESLLAEALDAGYLGMSVQTLPWDKMDGEEFRSRPLPSVFARWSEYRRLARSLRARGRVLQGVPNLSTKVNILLFLAQSVGLWRKSLKTSVISFIDTRADRMVVWLVPPLLTIFNRLLGADFRIQALPEPFDVWADGIDLVVFEEFGAGVAALHLADLAKRSELLADADYRARFKKQWRAKLAPKAFHRKLEYCEILACPPEPEIVGKTFADVARERGVDSVDAFLDLVMKHQRQLRWYTVMGNDRPRWLEKIVANPHCIIGFSDAGAHLRNMAHYNFPLRLLRMANDRKFMTIGRAVQRLTSEIAEWLGLPDVGRLEVGARADVAVVDPKGLNDDLEAIHEEEYPHFGMKRLVRRDSAVRAVLIGGHPAFRDGAFSPALGREKLGSVLRARC